MHALRKTIHLNGLAVSLLAIALLNWPALLIAEDESTSSAKPEGAENCVSLQSIRKTRIVDDQTIIFYMRGGDVFVNSLPRRCPGLKRAGAYSYATSLSRLCNTDIIRVLETFGSAFPRPAAACGLGFFSPSSEEAIDLMLNEPPEVNPEAVQPEIEAEDS